MTPPLMWLQLCDWSACDPACVHVCVLPFATDDVSCAFGSNKYYAMCGFGGILSCGLTHTAVVPLDLVKCRLQVCEPAQPIRSGGLRPHCLLWLLHRVVDGRQVNT